MSKSRLVSSYASIVVVLLAVAWAGAIEFPLNGRAEIRVSASPAPPVAVPAQNSPGYIVNISPLSYPAEAVQKRWKAQ